LRSSSIFKNIELVFHNSYSWVKIRFHTENQLPFVWGGGRVVVVGWGGGGGVVVVVVWVPLNNVVTTISFCVGVGL
jgi:hypothetical protein